jgi:SAM-dependent methyltransferase
VGDFTPFSVEGYCVLCEKETVFTAHGSWLRDFFTCQSCGSVPRERALVAVLGMLYPDWRSLSIHESSPSPRGASDKLRRECVSYTPTQYVAGIPLGDLSNGFRNEDLERQTFPSESFDLVVTQDVFEHVFHPDKAITEIARTLRPGGAHICTVPIVRKSLPTRRRAAIVDGQIKHYEPPEYHGSPVDESGVLVTIDWGYDIATYLSDASDMVTSLYYIDDISRGIRAEFIDVIVNAKLSAPDI